MSLRNDPGLIDFVNLKKAYQNGENIISKLKEMFPEYSKQDLGYFIEVSYDLQAGSYVENTLSNEAYIKKYVTEVSSLLKEVSFSSIMEVGCGEATTLTYMLKSLGRDYQGVFGFDLSLSRLFFAENFCREMQCGTVGPSPVFFTADLFNIPMKDSSVELVYTSHSIEPNGGRELEAVKELARVSSKYVLLLEPYYEKASMDARCRMDAHGYVKGLESCFVQAGLSLINSGLMETSSNPLNPTGYFLLEKNDKPQSRQNELLDIFRCPRSHYSLFFQDGHYFSPQSGLVYPTIKGVGCLTKDNSILASHYSSKASNSY